MDRSSSLVRLSDTGRLNASLRTAWAGYVADRALLVLSLAWIAGRFYKRGMIANRPDGLYDPLTWIGALVFPDPVSDAVWFGLAAAMAVGIGLCLWRPRLLAARALVATCAVLLVVTELGYGKIEHVNHLFLLAHVYALFLPVARPAPAATADASALHDQAMAARWYQAGLLAVYTASGLWKFGDMTIRDLLKPGMTWLHPDAFPAISALSYRALDFGLALPEAFYAARWVFPVGYVAMAFVLAPAAFAPFRRPLLLLVVPAIAVFHVMNVLTFYALFVSTIAVVLVTLTPYDVFIPSIRRRLVPVRGTRFSGRGIDARYEREYANGDTDVFEGFYAARARLEDRSWLWAAPLHYPGLARIATWFLRRRRARVSTP